LFLFGKKICIVVCGLYVLSSWLAKLYVSAKLWLMWCGGINFRISRTGEQVENGVDERGQ
jgi:hypothetical protein